MHTLMNVGKGGRLVMHKQVCVADRVTASTLLSHNYTRCKKQLMLLMQKAQAERKTAQHADAGEMNLNIRAVLV